MARARMGNGRRALGGAMMAVLLVAAACSGDDEATPEPDGSDESVETGETAAPVRYQDVWVYERISTVDLDGEVVDLTPAILATADDLGDPIDLAGDTEFLEWPGLEPYLIDGDGSTRDDVDTVAGIARQGDREAIMVVGTPAADDTPPIDEDDQVRIDLTAIEDQLQPGDPLVMEYTFAHTFGPDAGDAPDTGVDLFLHRAEQRRLRFAAGPDGGVALLTDLGQAYAGSVLAGTPAKAQPMMDGLRDGLGNCVGDIGTDCIGEYFEDFGEGAEASYRDIMDQVCVGDECDDDNGGDDDDNGGDDDGGGDNGGGDDGGGDDGGGDGGGGGDGDDGNDNGGDDDGKKGGFCPTYPHCDRDDPEPGDPGYCGAFPDADGCGADDPDAPDPDSGSTDGDPHIHTFDGDHYLIQSVGEFVLAEAGDWMTQVRYVSRDDRRRYSLADVVATRIGGHTVVLDPSPGDDDTVLEPTATLDGEPVDLVRNGPEVELDGLVFGYETGYLWVADPGVGSVGIGTLGYPRADVVVLDPDLEFQGLLGDRDGDKTNDLRLGPDGPVLDDPSQDEIHGDFADAWRVTDENSLFPYGPGESTDDHTDLDHPGEPIARAVEESGRQAQAETLCRIARVSEASMDACIIDYSVTGDVSWVTGSAISDRFRGFVRGEPEVGAAGDAAGSDGSVTTTFDGIAPIGDVPPGETDGDTLYQFGRDTETERDVLLAVDVAAGAERWRLDGVEARCGIGLLDDGRVAAVVKADKEADRAASFVVLDPESGAVDASADWADAPSTYCQPMLVSGDTVVVPDALGRLFGWSVGGDLAPAWTTDDTADVGAAVVTESGRIVVSRRGDGSGFTSELQLVDPADGSVTDGLSVAGRATQGAMIATGETVAFVAGATEEPTVVSTLLVVDVSGGSIETTWTLVGLDAEAGAAPDETIEGGFARLASDGDVLLAYAGPELLAFDLASGALRWRVDPDGFRQTTAPPVIVDDTIFDRVFGGVALLALSVEDGSSIGEQTDEDVFGPDSAVGNRGVYGPVIGDRLVVEGTDDDGRLVIAVVPI